MELGGVGEYGAGGPLALAYLDLWGKSAAEKGERLFDELQGLDLGYALGPCNEGCPLARGKPCVYTLMLRFQEAATAPPAA